jgi:hypothetical protein
MVRNARRTLLLSLGLLGLLGLLPATTAQQLNATVRVYQDSKTYGYMGCYNETTEIEGSGRTRALAGGANVVRKGEMTVPLCLDFCYTADNGSHYRYAGLEWSRYVLACLLRTRDEWTGLWMTL